MKCKICGRKMKLDKRKRYECITRPSGVLGALSESPRTYDAFDCDYCGCQNIVGVREERKVDPLKTFLETEADARKEGDEDV